MTFNENSRVKIPAILQLCRLGYNYISPPTARRDESTNIFTEIFSDSLVRLNPGIAESEITRAYQEIILCLDNEDLGKEFYTKLTATSGIKLLDFSNPENNVFHVVTEMTCKNGEDEFRPDITLLINGMPLAFIEVKKPNNADGVLAERERINMRFGNRKFRKFINISQILVFSNNMEYDPETPEPIQGAFYATTAAKAAIFNRFREEDPNVANGLPPLTDAEEDFVLADNHLSHIKTAPEFNTNKNPNSPTNRILTSLFRKDRFLTLLQFGIAYVHESHGIEKHIVRYPQFFAMQAIRQKLDAGLRKGIIWHTQGSGKTALAYYNVAYLTQYFQAKGVIPKFYFIVDRIDLLIQAKREFSMRGLTVQTVNSKEELKKYFQLRQAVHSAAGGREITVVNIQKFRDDTDVLTSSDYDVDIQRVYFLDEVHRSYNPKGSFLANLITSDKNAILIGLTGTPLLSRDARSTNVFGGYIHQYYYNRSIEDGYTLRLIREEIETSYKMQMQAALKEIDIIKGSADREFIYSHPKFVEPMLDYIIEDFKKSRVRLGDDSIGAMVICDSSAQAKKLFEFFEKSPRGLTAALILHDIGSKDERKTQINEFKEGKLDILFVYNMLLTGFDAKRLKKLYLGRVIKDHNLLQALTRVNRPYKDFRYGFVVDFADISEEFEKTNKAYLDELQLELGDELEHYSNLFKSKEEIERELEEIKDRLFQFDTENAEIFSQQISQIEDRAELLTIKKALENARNLYNLIRLYGHSDLLEKLDFRKLNQLLNETTRHLALLNLRESLESDGQAMNVLNEALENVVFMFRKIDEAQLIIADELRETLRKTRESLNGNFDKKDPQFVNLYEELRRIFTKHRLEEISQEEMRENIKILQGLLDRAATLNRQNDNLSAKYRHDRKFMRVHKRIKEKGISTRDAAICDALGEIKKIADEKVRNNVHMLANDTYFAKTLLPDILAEFEKKSLELTAESANYINNCIVREYLEEYHGEAA